MSYFNVTPLSLAKITDNNSSSYYLDALTRRHSKAGNAATSFVIKAIEDGYIEEKTINSERYSTSSYYLTDSGKELARTASFDDISSGEGDNAFNALWTLLLLRGSHEYYYGSRGPLGENGEILHLISCGLDYGESTMPNDNSWSEFAGTFNESDEYHGLAGQGTCRCGAVNGFDVSMKYANGIASMMLSLMNGIKGLLP